MSPDRLRELAIEAAFHNHCENSHPESFDVCVHDDCVLVRSAAPALASEASGSSLLEKLQEYSAGELEGIARVYLAIDVEEAVRAAITALSAQEK